MSENTSETPLTALRPATISDPSPEPVVEQSTETAPVEGETVEQTPEEKAAADEAQNAEKQRKSAAARIGAAVRAQREAERRADALDRRIADLEIKLSTASDPAEAQAALEQAQIEQRAEQRAQQLLAEREHQRAVTAFFSAGEKEDPEFRVKANSVGEILGPDTKGAVQIMTDLENGHRAVLRLADDPELAEKIFAMPVHKMAIELARLADKEPAKPKTPISNAPPPIKAAAGTAKSNGWRSNFTVEEHLAWAKTHAPDRR